MQSRRTMKLSAILVSLSILSTACADEKDPEPVPLSWECNLFLECMAAHVPTELPTEQREYGETSPCWQSSASAEMCSTECDDAREALLAQHPDYTACVECVVDDDCVGNLEGVLCSEDNNCERCLEHFHCENENACIDGECRECQSDSDCGEGYGACLQREAGNLCRHCADDFDCTALGYEGARCDENGWCDQT